MTITPASQRRIFNALKGLNGQLSTLQEQLGSGKKSSTYAGLGANRTISIDARRVNAGIEGYKNTIRDVNGRLTSMENTLSRMSDISQSVKLATNDKLLKLNSTNQTPTQTNAKLYADELVSLMNQDYGGRKMFSGRAVTDDAVESTNVILNGDGARAGLKTIISERQQADLGSAAQGRLTNAISTNVITLAEDGTHPFGFKLNTVSSTSANVTTVAPSGTPPSSTITFTGLPAIGDVVTIRLDLPDGTESTVSLAATSGTPGVGQFQIGADAATTAANFNTVLTTTLQKVAATELTAASNIQATNDFFENPPQRISGTPVTATALIDGTSSNTIFWYKGEDDGTSARQTSIAVIDDGQRIGYGVRATENGVKELLKSTLVLAATTFSASDANAVARYSELTDRAHTQSETANSGQGGIASIRAELGTTQQILDTTKNRHTARKGLMDDSIGQVEDISTEEVAINILSVQNRLQASYQVTANITRLSLMDYLR